MHEIIPPICFLLAFALIVTGFSMLAIGFPEASIQLHRARASGDEVATDALEANLKKRQRNRAALITASLVGGILITVTGFRAMRRR